jgi:hypothetical protein
MRAPPARSPASRADGLTAALGAPLLSLDAPALPAVPRRRVPRDVSLVSVLLAAALALLLLDAALHRRAASPGRPR